jgi:hypothetical protein
LNAALLILDLPGRGLRLGRARPALRETGMHACSGTRLSSTLSVRSGRGQQKHEHSSRKGRRTHSFRVPGPVHKSFSRL